MGLTKDFTNSPLHRFKKPGSKNYNNIFPPGNILHLSNIPYENNKNYGKKIEIFFFLCRTEITEDELRQIFSQYGTIKRFRFFEKDHKMALVEMDTIEQAIATLVVSILFCFSLFYFLFDLEYTQLSFGRFDASARLFFEKQIVIKVICCCFSSFFFSD